MPILATLRKRGQDAGGILVSLARASMSWEVNRAGLLNAFIPIGDVLPYANDGYTVEDLRAFWLSFEDPLAGRWAGQITLSNFNQEQGVQIVAESWHSLTRKRLTKKQAGIYPNIGYPGQLLKQALDETRSEGPLYLDYSTIPVLEKPQVAIEWNSRMDIYDDLIPQLTEDIEQEWKVNSSREVLFGKTIGRDRRAFVSLLEGEEIADYSIALDLWTITNYLIPLGTYTRNGTQYEDVQHPVVERPISQARYGMLMEPKDFGRVRNQEQVGDFAVEYLDRVTVKSAGFSLTLVPTGSEWQQFEEGDTVRVELPSIRSSYDMRIMVRVLDLDRGTLTVAGEGERV